MRTAIYLGLIEVAIVILKSYDSGFTYASALTSAMICVVFAAMDMTEYLNNLKKRDK